MHLRLLSTITLAGMLTLAIAGCGSEETASQTTASNTEVKRSPSVQPTAATQQIAQKPAPETAVDQPMAAQTSQNQGSSTAGLIQPTNVNQRTKQVQTGRSDPFAGLFTIPKVSVVPKPKKVPVPSLPKPPAPPPVVRQPIVRQPIVKPSAYVPPPPPQPDLARGVTVLGVVEVGNELQAIVQVPNEVTSRYVSEGQRLSDGQVLVKRIEINTGSEPTVILEQNGIEVTRAVGEEPVQPGQNQPTQPTAAIPVPSSFPSVSPTGELKTPTEQPTSAIPVPRLPSSSTNSVAEIKTMLQIEQNPNGTVPPPPSTNVSSQEELRSKLKEASLTRKLKID